MTEAKGEGYPGPVAGPDQRPGAARVAAIPGPSVAPLRRGEAERGITGPGRADSAASRTRAAVPGVPPRAAPGRVGPGGGGNPLGGPQPGRGDGQPAAGWKEAAAPPQGATEAEEEWEKAGPPLGEEPPGEGGTASGGGATGKRGSRGAEGAAEREGAPWRHTKYIGEEATRLRGVGGGPAVESAGRKQEERGPGHRGSERRGRRRRGRRTRGAKGPAAKTAWDWILLALCLWSALQAGAALVLKGNRVEGEVFAFNVLRCNNSHALARYSGPQFCDRG